MGKNEDLGFFSQHCTTVFKIQGSDYLSLRGEGMGCNRSRVMSV